MHLLCCTIIQLKQILRYLGDTNGISMRIGKYIRMALLILVCLRR